MTQTYPPIRCNPEVGAVRTSMTNSVEPRSYQVARNLVG